MLAHDLRNPLNTIGLNVHLAKTALEQGDPKLGPMALEHIERAKQQMVESVDRFRALARALYGEPVRQPVDIDRLARGVWERLAPAGVELTIHDLPRTVGDPKLAAALLWGLIASALEAIGGRSGGVIEIGHESGSDPPVYFVADDGSDLAQGEGTADGLWVREAGASSVDPWLELAVRGVARHGGEVRASRRAGGGVIVHFRFGGAGAETPATE
ncbi:MAG TPA: histidine kinase dimerization/phospho-acceptor domain-containing protein [Pseudomonadales bacterium]